MSSREQFEKALEAEKIRQGRPWHPSYVAVGTDGIYQNGATRALWWAWQASRYALEINLPSPAVDYSYRDSEVTGACKYHEFAVKAAASAGVRVKT